MPINDNEPRRHISAGRPVFACGLLPLRSYRSLLYVIAVAYRTALACFNNAGLPHHGTPFHLRGSVRVVCKSRACLYAYICMVPALSSISFLWLEQYYLSCGYATSLRWHRRRWAPRRGSLYSDMRNGVDGRAGYVVNRRRDVSGNAPRGMKRLSHQAPPATAVASLRRLANIPLGNTGLREQARPPPPPPPPTPHPPCSCSGRLANGVECACAQKRTRHALRHMLAGSVPSCRRMAFVLALSADIVA